MISYLGIQNARRFRMVGSVVGCIDKIIFVQCNTSGFNAIITSLVLRALKASFPIFRTRVQPYRRAYSLLISTSNFYTSLAVFSRTLTKQLLDLKFGNLFSRKEWLWDICGYRVYSYVCNVLFFVEFSKGRLYYLELIIPILKHNIIFVSCNASVRNVEFG